MQETLATFKVDVPRSVRAIATCTKSATIAVATDESITLFDMAQTSRKPTWMCEIGAARVKFVALSGDLLAYATPSEVLVLSYIVEKQDKDLYREGLTNSSSLTALCRSVLQLRDVEAQSARAETSLALKHLHLPISPQLQGQSREDIARKRASRVSIVTDVSSPFLFDSSDGKPPQNSVPAMNLPVRSFVIQLFSVSLVRCSDQLNLPDLSNMLPLVQLRCFNHLKIRMSWKRTLMKATLYGAPHWSCTAVWSLQMRKKLRLYTPYH